MKIIITQGSGWYLDNVGEEFEVYSQSDVGSNSSPEIGYSIEPALPNEWNRFVSEFDCKVVE